LLNCLPDATAGFFRTVGGAELDLVLQSGKRKIAIECKASAAPKPERGFYQALEDLNIPEAWIIAPVNMRYPLNERVSVMPIGQAVDELKSIN